MQYCKQLIKIAMDDAKDAEMIWGYAREASGTEMESFFISRMKARLEELDEDRKKLRMLAENGSGENPLWEHLEGYLDDKAKELRWAMEKR